MRVMMRMIAVAVTAAIIHPSHLITTITTTITENTTDKQQNNC
jgi:hypothetical protein